MAQAQAMVPKLQATSTTPVLQLLATSTTPVPTKITTKTNINLNFV